MRLNFGSIEFDAKGLPRIYSLRVSPSFTDTGPLVVSILLERCDRAAVEKWAARLGVEVADRPPFQSRPDARWTHTYEAVREDDGIRVKVWTSIELDEPAVPVAPEVPAADGKAAGLPAILALVDATDPDMVVQLADPKAAAECPCGCTSAFCRCCDPETCTCGPACPICDEDGGV